MRTDVDASFFTGVLPLSVDFRNAICSFSSRSGPGQASKRPKLQPRDSPNTQRHMVRALPFAASFFLWLADKTRVALPGANAASGDGFVLVGVAATASNASMDNDTSKQGSNWTRPRQDKEHTCVAMSCSARRGTTAQPTITQRVVARLWSYRDRRLMACIAHHDVAQLATKYVRDDGVAARVTDLAAQV